MNFKRVTIYGAVKNDDGTEYAEVERSFNIDESVSNEELEEYLESVGIFRIPETDRIKVGLQYKSEKRRYVYHDYKSKIDRIVDHLHWKPNRKHGGGSGKGKVKANRKGKTMYRQRSDSLSEGYLNKGD